MNRHRAARVLAEATVCSDSEAARRFGVTPKSVARWREGLKTDSELADLYAHYLALLDDRWRRELMEVTVQTAHDLRELQALTHAKIVDVFRNPGNHLDENGRPPNARDMITLAQGAMAELRSTLEKSAELLTHHAAIVAEPPEPHGPPRKTRAFNAPAPGGADVAPGTRTEH